MPYAVTLRTDADTARSVAGMVDTLASRGVSRSQRALGYPAHVTLAISDVLPNSEALELALPPLAKRRALALHCVGFGVFAGLPCCLWLAPVMTGALRHLHGCVLSALTGTCQPHYRQDAWVPHITLADDLPDAAAAAGAIAAIGFGGLPLPGTLDRIEVVRFPPVEILRSVPLSD